MHSDPESSGLPAEQQGEKMSSFFRSLGSKKKSKSSLALSEGSEWGGNTTGGSWPSEQRRLESWKNADADADADADACRLDPGKEEERRRQAAAAEERGEKLERENNLLRLKVFLLRNLLGWNIKKQGKSICILKYFRLKFFWICSLKRLLKPHYRYLGSMNIGHKIVINFKHLPFPLQDSEILRLRESLDLESLNSQPVRLV